MPNTPIKIDEWFDNNEVGRLQNTIVVRCMNLYKGCPPRDEVTGYAGLGLVRAALAGDIALITGAIEERKGKIKNWLIQKGTWETCDLLRSSGLVDRTVRGKIVRRKIKTVSLGLGRHDSGSADGPIDFHRAYTHIDSRAKDPSSQIEAEDFFKWAMQQLNLVEWEIFRYYYVCRLCMRQIAVVLTLHESRVSQIHGAAVRRLRLSAEVVYPRP